MFKIGDKVKVIDDDQKGIVKQIHQNRITIENEFGFEEIYLSHEILLDESLEISHVEMDFSEKIQIKTQRKSFIRNQRNRSAHRSIGRFL